MTPVHARAPATHLALTALLVPDYDEALAFCTSGLGWTVREDRAMGGGKRWVVVGPDSPGAAGLLLARAATPAQLEQVGRQGGGRVWLFVHTTCFDDTAQRLEQAGARFTETARAEPYGRVAVFEDPWGNRWDLIEPAASPPPAAAGPALKSCE